MEEYVLIFGRFVLGVDIALLIVMIWCVHFNFKNLYRHNYVSQDISFRTIMLIMSVVYSIANFEAFKRHVNTFVVSKPYLLTYDTVESLLSDRTLMLFTAIFMVFLTKKYIPSWFR